MNPLVVIGILFIIISAVYILEAVTPDTDKIRETSLFDDPHDAKFVLGIGLIITGCFYYIFF